MRRALALLLFACFGITLPTAASPLRLCLLEDNLVSAVLAPLQSSGEPTAPCCPRCPKETDEGDSCCVVVEELPDYSAPRSEPEAPPVKVSEAPAWAAAPPTAIPPVRGDLRLSERIRGPASGSACRSLFSVWRL